MLNIPSITITTPAISIPAPRHWLLIFLVAVNLALVSAPTHALASTTNNFYLDPKDPSTLFGISDENGFHYGITDYLGSPSLILDEEGNVEQRNINTIITPYMEKHDQRSFKFINQKTTYHIAPRGTFREK